MKKFLGFLILALGLVLPAVGCGGPALFEASNLTFQPRGAMAGDMVTVAVEIRNTGDVAGSYPLTLRVNGREVESREVRMEAGATERAAFTIGPVSEGPYELELAGLQASFTVTMSLAQVIAQAGQQVAGLSSFHFELEHEGAGTPLAAGLELQKAVGDVAAPNRIRATIDATMMGMAVQVKVVVIGDTVFMTNPLPPGQWQSFASGLSPVGFFDPQTGVSALFEGITDLASMGEAEVSGEPAYHISGRVPAGALEPFTGSSLAGAMVGVELWVDQETFWLRRVKLMGRITPMEGEGIVRWLLLSRFNQETSIEPPL
ncbi:MAG: LppX_LprAFG lipoprotein [Dehalococcoidia bacterium]